MTSCMDGKQGSDEVKRRANSLMRDAGRAHLTPIGVQQMSRSARRWTADRGWWLINVEFQAADGGVGPRASRTRCPGMPGIRSS